MTHDGPNQKVTVDLYIPQLYDIMWAWGPRAAGQWCRPPRGEPAPVVGPRRAVSHGPPEFEWDEYNEEKLLLRHNVSALEAEQCSANANTRRRHGDALLLMGATDSGRMLFLVYEQKANGVVRVYSAREMTDKERRVYRRNAR